MMRQHSLRSAVLILLLAAIGCSRGDGRTAVSGTVSVDGEPLSTGAISFQPPQGSPGFSAGGKIEDGKFSLPTDYGPKPGKYVVTVQALRSTGRTVENRGMKSPEMLPLQFNETDKLEVTITDSGANHFDFPLTTARPLR